MQGTVNIDRLGEQDPNGTRGLLESRYWLEFNKVDEETLSDSIYHSTESASKDLGNYKAGDWILFECGSEGDYKVPDGGFEDMYENKVSLDKVPKDVRKTIPDDRWEAAERGVCSECEEAANRETAEHNKSQSTIQSVASQESCQEFGEMEMWYRKPSMPHIMIEVTEETLDDICQYFDVTAVDTRFVCDLTNKKDPGHLIAETVPQNEDVVDCIFEQTGMTHKSPWQFDIDEPGKPWIVDVFLKTKVFAKRMKTDGKFHFTKTARDQPADGQVRAFAFRKQEGTEGPKTMFVTTGDYLKIGEYKGKVFLR